MTVKLKEDGTYFIPLGGVGEIGKNCYLYADQDEFLMVDCGINFPDKRHPGIDFILPDLTFVDQNIDKLQGLVITHAHEDHIGAIPYLWERLKCPIYAPPFAAELIEKKLAEVGLRHEVTVEVIRPGETWDIGSFEINVLHITHSVPDATMIMVRTQAGALLHTGDWKLDRDPVVGDPPAFEEYKKMGKEGVLAMMCDSTNADSPGRSGSEGDVRKELVRVFKEQPNAIAVALFSSNVARVDSVLHAANKTGRDICLVGRSLKRNIEIGMDLGYLKDLPNIIPEEDAANVPRNRIVYLCTGCQGEARAAMSRIAYGNHKNIQFASGDTVIFSANRIPGNEVEVLNMQNTLASQGVHIITPRLEPIHVSGHPNQEELKELHNLIKPKFMVPIHGEDQHLSEHIYLTNQWGTATPISCYNGTVLEITPESIKQVGQIDLQAIGLEEYQMVNLESDRLQQRRKIAHNGAAVVTVLQNPDNTFQKPVRVSLMGLYDTKEQQVRLSQDIEDDVQAAMANIPRKDLADFAKVHEYIRLGLRRSLKKLTGKKPVIDVQLIHIN